MDNPTSDYRCDFGKVAVAIAHCEQTLREVIVFCQNWKVTMNALEIHCQEGTFKNRVYRLKIKAPVLFVLDIYSITNTICIMIHDINQVSPSLIYVFLQQECPETFNYKYGSSHYKCH